MNKKYILIFVFLFIILLISGIFIIKKLKTKEQETATIEEYIPEEEISEEQKQDRDTVVTVYFLNKETGKIMPEAKVVDVKEMINNPYQTLIQLLIEGPTNEKLEKTIPENTTILGTSLKNECLTINVSSEILNYDKEKENAKENLIESVVNTLTELTEVNKVKIIIEGQENEEFKEPYERLTDSN